MPELVAKHPELSPDLKSRLEFVLLLREAESSSLGSDIETFETQHAIEYWFEESLKLTIGRKVKGSRSLTGGSKDAATKSIEPLESIRIPKKVAARYESAAEMMADMQLFLQREPLNSGLGRKFARSIDWFSHKPFAGLMVLLAFSASLILAGVILAWTLSIAN